MKYFYVNKEAQVPPEDGEHEVHTEGCQTPPFLKNRVSLGCFAHCKDALKEAKKRYRNVDGCKNCIPECHKV